MEIEILFCLIAFLGWCGAYYHGRDDERKRWQTSLGPYLLSVPNVKENKALDEICPPDFQRVAIATTPERLAVIRTPAFGQWLDAMATQPFGPTAPPRQ